jgi:4-hydroxy-tetrahydrodipicolinate synthase
MALEYSRSESKSWAVKNLRGFYECPITPISPDFSLDEAGIRENLEAYVGMGIPGLVVGGNVAEGWNLTHAEWMRYHEIIADANKGRMKLWTIILDHSVHQALEKLDRLQGMGFEGAEVMNPPFQLKSDDEIYAYFKYLTDHSDLAVMLYRTPVSGKTMSIELMERICDLDTVVGMKQGSLVQGDTLRVRNTLRKDLVVSEPIEYHFLEDLRVGGQVMWANFNYIAFGKLRGHMKAYFDLAMAGDFDAAREEWLLVRAPSAIFEEIMLTWVIKTGSYATAIAYMKAWFEMVGLKAGTILPPVEPLSGERREWLQAKLMDAGVI